MLTRSENVDFAARRPDLLHLSPEALTQLANAGLVKRAQRERESGCQPALALQDDGTLVATFSDGVITRWPPGQSIHQSSCTCPAPGLCRHRLIAALQFIAEAQNKTQNEAWHEAQSETPAPAATPDTAPNAAPESHPPANPAALRSPGQASDEDLAALLPPATYARAQREREAGLTVQVRRRSPPAAGKGPGECAEPCDTAHLPAATVRFWAGAHLGAARCDCVQQTACEHVALGVWAFREADAQDAARLQTAPTASPAPVQSVQLGPPASAIKLDAAPYLAAVAALLRHGVTQGNAAAAPALSAALQAARAAGAEWLWRAVLDLEQWSAAWAARSARYRAEAGADAVAEIALRLTLGSAPGQAGAALGMGQPHEVPLDRLRLMCLGARTERDGQDRRTLLVMADADTGARMALLHAWRVPDERRAQEAQIRASERIAPGVRLEQLAGGQLLSQQARRYADGSVALARARNSQNSLLPQSGDWAALAPPLRYASVRGLRQARASCPHPLAAPRHAAGRFVIFSPARIEEALYDPHSQTVQCLALDAEDAPVLIRRSHAAHTPHALHALALALTQSPAHIGGLLDWQGDLPVLEPWSVAVTSPAPHLHVLDFAGPAPESAAALAALPLGRAEGDVSFHPLQRALAALRALCADLLHHGSAVLPRAWPADAAECAARLQELSFAQLAAHTRRLAACHANPAQAAPVLAALLGLRQLHEDAMTQEAAARNPDACRPRG